MSYDDDVEILYIILFNFFWSLPLMLVLGVAYLVFRSFERTRSKSKQWTSAFFAVEMSVALWYGWYPWSQPYQMSWPMMALSIVVIIGAVIFAARGFKTHQSAASSADRERC